MREVPLPAPTGRISKMMKDNAKKALREWRNELIGSPKRMSSDSTTIAKYVKHYISVLEANKIVEASTLGCYREMLKTIERYDIGSIKLNDLSAEDAETCHRRQRHRRSPCSPHLCLPGATDCLARSTTAPTS